MSDRSCSVCSGLDWWRALNESETDSFERRINWLVLSTFRSLLQVLEFVFHRSESLPEACPGCPGKSKLLDPKRSSGCLHHRRHREQDFLAPYWSPGVLDHSINVNESQRTSSNLALITCQANLCPFVERPGGGTLFNSNTSMMKKLKHHRACHTTDLDLVTEYENEEVLPA